MSVVVMATNLYYISFHHSELYKSAAIDSRTGMVDTFNKVHTMCFTGVLKCHLLLLCCTMHSLLSNIEGYLCKNSYTYVTFQQLLLYCLC